MKTLQCCVCGHVNTWRKYRYFHELLSIYSVGYSDICEKCADRVNKFIDYYGEKKPEDKAKVHRFLISGVLPMRDFSALMNAGYWV